MFSQLIHAPAAVNASSYSTTRPAKDFGAVLGMLQSPDPRYGTDSPVACPTCIQARSTHTTCAHTISRRTQNPPEKSLEDYTAEFGAPPPPYGDAGAPSLSKKNSDSCLKKSKGSLVSRGALWCFGLRAIYTLHSGLPVYCSVLEESEVAAMHIVMVPQHCQHSKQFETNSMQLVRTRTAPSCLMAYIFVQRPV